MKLRRGRALPLFPIRERKRRGKASGIFPFFGGFEKALYLPVLPGGYYFRINGHRVGGIVSGNLPNESAERRSRERDRISKKGRVGREESPRNSRPFQVRGSDSASFRNIEM